jgi:ESS family glutamate:Na+ symporter
MPNLFKAAGIILPMGYGQGPGQANNIGSTYEALGFTGGRSFALSIAAAGYLCACIVGVIYMNILVRKNAAVRRDSTGKMEEESLAVENFRDKDEIPISESIDLFSIQFALIAICYLLTYLICKGLSALVPGLASLLWGFNFIFGSLMAAIVTLVLRKLREKGVMQKQYQNNFLLARISGFAFDLMIVGGIASIDIEDLSGLWVPFILMAVLGGLATLVYLRVFCKKLFPGYVNEAFFGMYGMLTGTISSGVLLVRELDPDLRTPAAMNLVTGSSFGIAFGAPVLVLVGMAPSKLVLAIAIIVVYWAALVVFLLRFKGFSKKKK